MQDRNKEFREAMLNLGLGTVMTRWPETFVGAGAVRSAFTNAEWSYIAQRGQEYGLTPEWVVAQFNEATRKDPALLIDLLDKAGKHPGVQFEHIVSQNNAPHLAHDPDNIILAPADGFNQALGSDNMTPEQVADRVQDFHDYANHSTNSFHFEDAWDLFGDFTYGICRGVFAFRKVEKHIWVKTIRFAQRIINDMPQVKDRATRKRMLDDLVAHIDLCASDASCHTAVLMTLLITNVPWAAPMLAAFGLATLAKLCIDYADQFAERLESKKHLTWAGKLLRFFTKPLKFIINLFHTILSKAWEIVDTVVKFAADMTVKVYNAAKTLVTTIWNGVKSAWGWMQLLGMRDPSASGFLPA